tara:strand:+ start:1499 stop:1765 length:267 start_codon:yes stop_codon:yes gene_type:complete
LISSVKYGYPSINIAIIQEGKGVNLKATSVVEKVAYSVKDASEYVGGINESTMYRLLWDKTIKSYKIGQRRFILKSELDKYIQENMEE